MISNNAFDGPTNLIEISLPRSLREIQKSAFRSNTKIREIEIPTGVTTIASTAFDKCTTLNFVTLPSTLTYLGANAFHLCNSLNEVYVKAVAPPYCDINEWYDYDWNVDVIDYAFDEDQFYNVIVFVPKQSLDQYQNASTWEKFTNLQGIWYPNEFEPGDVNHDNKVNISDVTALIDLILNNSGGDNEEADVNGDNRVNISDVTTLIDMILSGN